VLPHKIGVRYHGACGEDVLDRILYIRFGLDPEKRWGSLLVMELVKPSDMCGE
jgi:hypothetical protein